VRQVRQDLVVSAAGCRIDEHLEQRPAEASSGPVTRNRPEVGQRHADLDITLSDGGGRRRTLTEPPLRAASWMSRTLKTANPEWLFCARDDAARFVTFGLRRPFIDRTGRARVLGR
jgi:hypothetical protein